MSRPRLCYVVSSELTARAFLLEHIRAAAALYDVSVVANTSDTAALRALGVPVDITPVAIERCIAPFADLAALWALYRYFRQERFDLVHSLTPKAGLLSALAGALAGVRVRLHTFTGQMWATRAIIPVHLAGWPCDMTTLMALARARNLLVLEDCAQAVGATWNGRPVGSFGDMAAYSFCQDKIITTGGEGGMLLTSRRDLWERAWAYKDHGKSWAGVHDRAHPPGFRWVHESFGSNYRRAYDR